MGLRRERDRVPGAGAKRRYDLEPGGVLDPEPLLGDALAVLQEARREHGGAEDVIGASCFWHSLLPLDLRGRPLTPLPSEPEALSSRRRRGRARAPGRRASVP